MKFQVLGCSGSDLPGYHLTSFRINESILLDAGSVTSSLALEEQAELTDVFITHSHLDHIKDILFLADNLIELVVRDSHGPVHLHGLEDVLASIKTHLMNDTIWPDFTVLPKRDTPVLVYSPMQTGIPHKLNGLDVYTWPVNHAKAASGYIFKEREKGGSFAFTGDTGPTKGWWEFLNSLPFEVENLVIETSFPNEMEELALVSKHLTPALLRKELALLNYTPKIFISHIKSTFSSAIQEQLQVSLEGFSYHLLRDGEVLNF